MQFAIGKKNLYSALCFRNLCFDNKLRTVKCASWSKQNGKQSNEVCQNNYAVDWCYENMDI